MDDVINCLHLGVNIVLLDPENMVEIVIMLRSELEVKWLQNATFRIYMAAILKTCHTYNFYFIIIGFLDPETIRIDTKIVFLSGLRVKTSPKTQFNDCCVAILFLPAKKDSSRIPSWHPQKVEIALIRLSGLSKKLSGKSIVRPKLSAGQVAKN